MENGQRSAVCGFAIETIESMGDGRVGRTRLLRLRRHLKGCPECAGSFERMSALLAAFEEMPRVEAPPGFVEKVLRLLMPKQRKAEGGRRGRRGLLWVAGAAAFGLAVALAVAGARRLPGKGAGRRETEDKFAALGHA